MMRNAVLLLLAAAAAAAPDDSAALAERLQQARIERFFKQLDGRAGIDEALKARVLRLRDGALLGGEYDCIHQSLLLLSDPYKRADALFQNERYATAADLLASLRADPDPYLAAYASYRFGLCQMHRELYEAAAEALRGLLNDPQLRSKAGCDVDAAFYLAVALGQMREKEQALVAAKRFLEDYPDAPERYRSAMEQMLNELVQEWESPLYDLSGKMNHVGRAIESGETGAGTQGKQKEIVEILDALIKKAEDNEGKGGGGGGGGGGTPRGNDQSQSPANQSKIAPGASRVGDLRPKERPKLGEKWGEMKDKERDEVLQALKEKLPERYRELLEQYHRQLAEGRRVTEPDDRAGGDGE